jgi:hypothetical protein
MNALTVNPAESPTVQAALSWPEFLLIGLAVLTVVLLAIIAPRRRGRMMLVTDVLKAQGEPGRKTSLRTLLGLN